MPARDFVSHSRKDGRAAAVRVKRELETDGHEVWLDEQIDPGPQWSDEIQDRAVRQYIPHAAARVVARQAEAACTFWALSAQR